MGEREEFTAEGDGRARPIRGEEGEPRATPLGSRLRGNHPCRLRPAHQGDENGLAFSIAAWSVAAAGELDSGSGAGMTDGSPFVYFRTNDDKMALVSSTRQALRPFVKLRTGELRRASGQAQRVGVMGRRGSRESGFLETQLQRTQDQGTEDRENQARGNHRRWVWPA